MREKKHRLYKCPVCDTVVEVLEECGLELVCCGPSMTPLTERPQESDVAHGVAIEWTGDGVAVRVGAGEHPMEGEHFISWIDLTAGNACYRQFLQPGAPAEASFPAVMKQPVTVRVYCSAHGLYRAEATPPAISGKYIPTCHSTAMRQAV